MPGGHFIWALGHIDAGGHSRLYLVCRAPVSLWRLDVRATAWSGSTAETGTDELTTGERRDLPKNETTGVYGVLREEDLLTDDKGF